METKFKIGDFVKYEVYDEFNNYCRTVKGKITQIIIKDYGIVCKLDTEKNISYDENLLEKVDE